MTLSRFLRDYIYIPLGGNRKGEGRTYFNLFATFVLGGIWHGAGWTFVFWGVLHGTALIIHRLWQSLGFKLNSIVAWFITFNFINIAWVFFRAKEFDDALKVLDGMFFGTLILPGSFESKFTALKEFGVTFGGGWLTEIYKDPFILLWLILASIGVLLFKNSMEWKDSFKPNYLYLTSTILLFLSIFLLSRKSEFIYFNF